MPSLPAPPPPPEVPSWSRPATLPHPEAGAIASEHPSATPEQAGVALRNAAGWEDSEPAAPPAQRRPGRRQPGHRKPGPREEPVAAEDPDGNVRNSPNGVDAGPPDEDPLAGENRADPDAARISPSPLAGGPPLAQPQPQRPLQLTDSPLTSEPAPCGTPPGPSRELAASTSRSSLRQVPARRRYSAHSEARLSRLYGDQRPNSIYRYYGHSGGQHQIGGFDESGNPIPALPAGPLLDHSHLKPGTKAKLLDYGKTLEMYRANAKKSNDNGMMFEFACFLLDAVKEMEEQEKEQVIEQLIAPPEPPPTKIHKRRESEPTPLSVPLQQSPKISEKASLTAEAISLLQKLANRSHVESQFVLADCYTNGIGTHKGRRDYDKAFPLYVLSAKHGHVEAAYRSGQCLEFGRGTKKERDKAVTFYRKAAVGQFPAAMYRVGLAEMNGELGLPRRPKEGVKWLKRAAETADESNPKPLHELALLHECGVNNVVFVDHDYAVELLARASEFKYAPSAFKLGECYEYGRMGCSQDAALSIHYYNIAAQQNHREACFSLTAWYLVGSPGVLPQSDAEAYLWAKKAADLGLAKAMYAVGYFTEVGIGTPRDPREAIRWFRKAVEHGDKRAAQRLRNGPDGTPANHNLANRSRSGKDKMRAVSGDVNEIRKNKEDCVIM